MPSIAKRQKVLDGRAEVLSYARDPQAFYLRVWNNDTRSYRSSRIDGVSDIETAASNALDVYLEIGKDGTQPSKRKPKRGPTQGQTKRQKLDVWVEKYLANELEKVDAGLLKAGTVKNKCETLRIHFLAYCKENGVENSSQVAVGVFDRYPVYRAGCSRHTVRRELAAIKMFLAYLHRNKLLNPYEYTDQLLPKIQLKDEDWDSNPPIRDDQEWKTILKHLHRYVKEGDVHPRPRVGLSRKRFWTLLLVLKNTGLRPAEALALRWSDIETQNIFRETSSGAKVDRYIVHIRVLASKTGALREVTANCAQPLARWKREQRIYLDKYEQHFRWNGVTLNRGSDGLPVIPQDALVFALPEKSEWSVGDYTNLTYQWRQLMDRCRHELKGPILSPHRYNIYSLRSTRSQELFELGVDPFLAGKQMGHSPDQMAKIYARLPSRKRAIKEAAYIQFGRREGEDAVTVDLDQIS